MKNLKERRIRYIWNLEFILFEIPINIIKSIFWFISSIIVNTKTWFLFSIKFSLPYRSIKNHLYIMAWSWSGKSEFLKLIAFYLIKKSRKNAVVIFDPHWDLAVQIARWKMWRGNSRFALFDWFLKPWFLFCFNPFLIREKSEKEVERMTQALVRSFEWILANTFTPNMETMLNYLFPILLRREGSNLKDLKRFVEVWDYANNQDLWELGLNSPNPEHREYFENDFADRTLDITKKGLRNRVSSLLSSPNFAKIVTAEKNSFDFESLLDSWKVIVFNLAKWNYGDSVSQALWSFLVWHMQYLAFKRVSVPEKKRNSVFMIMDEFHNFTMKDPKRFESMLDEVRKYWFSLILAHQRPKQITPDLRESIEENAQINIKWYSKKDDELKILKRWEFIIEIWGEESKAYKTPTFLLKFKTAMTRRKWNLLKDFQLAKYYKNFNKWKNIQWKVIVNIEDEMKNELENFIPNL